MQTETDTQFAPAERAGGDALSRQAAYFDAAPVWAEMLDAIPDVVLVLNRQRQIVFANRRLLEMTGAPDQAGVRGLRPGEALRCGHSVESAGGCGTTRFCSVCGAVRAILASQYGEPDVQECRITRSDGDALDLRVRTRPLTVAGEAFTLFTLTDIADEKRRRALERVFFHDLINTATALRGLSALLSRAEPAAVGELGQELDWLTERLIAEVQAQSELAAAESNELAVSPGAVSTLALLRRTADAYGHLDIARGRHIRIDPGAQDVMMIGDKTLLARVIGNLLKNALEACAPGETVTLGCSAGEAAEQVEFRVHNPGVMPREVQLQVFQRSFSTKGPGRGLGTYSVKLLTERYLQGRVWFESAPETGTTFYARYPQLLFPGGEPP